MPCQPLGELRSKTCSATAEYFPDEELLPLLAAGHRLLDVRSEGEFAKSTLPQSLNLPLLKNEERHLVGIEYKEKGQPSAIALGEKLVSGETKAERIRAWTSHVQNSQVVALYCARGGLRSKISQQWLSDYGVPVARIRGGYKRIRNVLIESLERLCAERSFIVVSGRTGSGKTDFLGAVSRRAPVIDIEGIACHRGSVFGETASAQPAQATFENEIALALLRLELQYPDVKEPIYIEAESQRVGRLYLPNCVYKKMQESKILVLECEWSERVTRIVREYVDTASAVSENQEAYFLHCVKRIERRLGGERAKRVSEMISEACAQHRATGSSDSHTKWISALLQEYYDPHYDRHLDRSTDRILGRGDAHALYELLEQNR